MNGGLQELPKVFVYVGIKRLTLKHLWGGGEHKGAVTCMCVFFLDLVNEKTQ